MFVVVCGCVCVWVVGKPNLVKCFGPRLCLWTWTLYFVPGPSFSKILCTRKSCFCLPRQLTVILQLGSYKHKDRGEAGGVAGDLEDKIYTFEDG